MREGTMSDGPRITLVKVFSATKKRDRDDLGEKITSWLRTNPGVEVLRTVVTQSSDAEFHCFSITLFATDDGPDSQR
jgi:hypothetical protein